jgi:hypothetical protein
MKSRRRTKSQGATLRNAAKRKKSAGDPAKPIILETAIIGGGIAGLYCAYKLGQTGHQFLVAEETAHLGGRIWSTRILENGNEVPDDRALPKSPSSRMKSSRQRLEICAEFGPMRLELELQEELRTLLNNLGFKPSDYEPFPPYESPTSEHDPKYELKGEELDQATPLDLLILAIVRVLGRLRAEGEVDTTKLSLRERLRSLFDALAQAAATHQPIWKECLVSWIKSLGEPDYQNIRQFGIFDDGTPKGTPLWMMGFWNLLSEVLSHHAVMRIRDLGAFYHLIPENPNAAEWLIFWLRGLRTSEAMVGIRGGMKRISEKIAASIRATKIKRGYKLIHIGSLPTGEIRLEFANAAVWHAQRVILALPKAPLVELVRTNKNYFYSGIHEDLDSVFAFPMLKLFLIVKERWWNQDFTRTNRYATLIPAREIHYRSSPLEGSKKGMILLYTDRPASSFWANYVQATPPRASRSVANQKRIPLNQEIITILEGIRCPKPRRRPHSVLWHP